MKIVDLKKGIDPETYAPILRATVDIPIESFQDALAQLGPAEFSKIVGIEFVREIFERLKTADGINDF